MSANDKPKKELKNQLEEACEDLWWSSESDYPVEVVWQPEVDISPDSAAEAADRWVSKLHSEDAVKKVDLNDFFERAIAPKSWHTDEDKEQLRRLQTLRDFLTDQMPDLQVYRCGEVEIRVYVLGCAEGKVLAGIRTTVVET